MRKVCKKEKKEKWECVRVGKEECGKEPEAPEQGKTTGKRTSK